MEITLKEKKIIKWDCAKDGHLFETHRWTEVNTAGKIHYTKKICRACMKIES